MAIAEGKDRRGLTLPLEIWEAIDTAAAMEHSSAAAIVTTAIQHQCPAPALTDMAQVALDVRELQADLKALVGLLERRFLDEASPAPVLPAVVTPKQALDEWYASNRILVADLPADEPWSDVASTDTRSLPWWVRLWHWLVYR